MRHIPEDELHAYLDQALSRSQCVEIESHLAGCGACRAERDGIAALRDRTTALLATLTPPRRFIPAAEVLRERAAERSALRRDRWRAGMWAASVMLALGLGWTSKAMLGVQPVEPQHAAADQRVTSPSILGDSAPATTPDSAAPVAVASASERTRSASGTSARHADVGAVRPERAAPEDFSVPVPVEPVSTVLSSAQLPGTPLNVENGTLFRTVSWDNARHERGEAMPKIAGLPVVEVQVGTSHGGTARPLVVVAQQLESGQVIRTIEGPATDVSKLLASQRNDSGSPWPTIADSIGIAGGDGAMAMRRGDRILAITAPLSSDSLRAMIRRLNAGSR